MASRSLLNGAWLPVFGLVALLATGCDKLGGLAYPRSGMMAPPPTQAPAESYEYHAENPFFDTEKSPLSTFSVDVDTASYSNLRRILREQRLPPVDAVRIEEMINYFSYSYPPPKDGAPVVAHMDASPCPWKPEHRLVRIGLQTRVVDAAQVGPRNLVFLLDVSGSMMPYNRLPTIKQAMRLLVEQLDARDSVAIVVYAGASGLALPPTSGDRKTEILAALEKLEAGGSTNGGAGIELAYDVAQRTFQKGGINRVILATDGDFNVGVSSQNELVRLIEEKRNSGVFLTVLGVGEGNLKDSTMEQLADKGNGNYAYIDSLMEARKVLVQQAGGTLVTVAKDVKLQVEFNPKHVSSYRLVGYENRVLNHSDFKDDRKDAGDMGSGQSVTALYEIVPQGQPGPEPGVDPLKYQARPAPTQAADSGEWMTVKVRYKEPEGAQSRELVFTHTPPAALAPSADTRLATAVAEFGLLLRKSEHRGAADYGQVLSLLEEVDRAGTPDPQGYRKELRELVSLARKLSASSHEIAR